MKSPDELLNNVHISMQQPLSPCTLVTGKYAYYHYRCDSIDDRGWGCGYRTLQTLCSWVYYNNKDKLDCSKCPLVPSICKIQEALVAMKDKPKGILNSHEWIGSFEVCLCLDYFYDVPCKIHHIRPEENLFDGLNVLWEHFEKCGSPVMMGGNCDAASKCLLGICGNNKQNCKILVLDPHCSSISPSQSDIIDEKWISWRNIDTLDSSSFYNLCLPQSSVSHK